MTRTATTGGSSVTTSPATKELLEKLQWHLAGVAACSASLERRGYTVKTGALSKKTKVPLLVISGGKTLSEQVSVKSRG